MQQESTWCIKNMKHCPTHLEVPKTLCPPLLYIHRTQTHWHCMQHILSHKQTRPYSSHVVTCSYKPQISSTLFTWLRTEGPICIVQSHKFPKETADISIHPAVQTLQHTVAHSHRHSSRNSHPRRAEHRGHLQQAVSFTDSKHWVQCSLHRVYKVPTTSSSSPAHRPSFPAGGKALQRSEHCAFIS